MLLAIDKPTGITSYDVIRRLKPLFPHKTKIGHAGTLDPMATGLMLVGVTREGTKLLHHLQGLDKIYTTTIDFSIETDTRDMDYRETIVRHEVIKKDGKAYLSKNNQCITIPNQQAINQTLTTIIPSASLPLTPFNAKKVNGKKGYELARVGKPRIEAKEMKIYGYEILEYTIPLIKLKLHVGSGTYIRSIGHRLGQQYNLGGTLTSLRRERIGPYTLSKIVLDQEKDGILFGEIKYIKIT